MTEATPPNPSTAGPSGEERPSPARPPAVEGWQDEVFEQEQDEHTKKLLIRLAKNRHKVDRADLENTVRETQKQRDSFLRLPFTLLFFVVFVMAMLNHENIADSSMVQRELRGMLTGSTYEGIQFTSGHKTLEDIDTVDDVYTYMLEVVCPLFINDLAVTPARDLHRVLRYNQLIGGVELSQVRRSQVPCGNEYPQLGPFKDGTNPLISTFGCHPWYTESTECFGPDDATLRAGGGWCVDATQYAEESRRLDDAEEPTRRLDYVPQGGGTGGSTKGASSTLTRDKTFSLYLFENDGLTTAKARVNALKDNEWLDLQTAWLGMRMLVLNPDLAIFVHVTVHVYFSPSGSLLPRITAQSFQPEPYQYISVIGLDICFIFLLIYLAVKELWRVCKASRKGVLKDWCLDLWNWLDIGVVMIGLVVIILWVVLLTKLDVVKQKAMKVREHNIEPGGAYRDETFVRLVASMHAEMTTITDYLMYWRLVLCWYTLLMSMRFLESFSAQPRLAVVTNTIGRACSDLLHFLIVLVIVFLSYCVAGMFLFGRRLWEFSSAFYTINTCLRMMLGDFDWDSLVAEHPVTANLWFMSFILLMMLLMLNMLMAIVMDKYTEVKSDAEQSDPIWQQVIDMSRDTVNKYTGQTVGNSDLLKVIEAMEEVEVDKEMLMDKVGAKLHQEQAEALINATQEFVDNELNKGVTMSEAMRMIGWVKIAVQKIGWKLEDIMNEEREAFGLNQPDKDATDQAENGATSQRDAAPAALQSPDVDPCSIDVDERVGLIENRIVKIEKFLNEALSYTSFRGKDLRNRLAVIEDLVRSQRHTATLKGERDAWQEQRPRL